jgi:LysM repeat protein
MPSKKVAAPTIRRRGRSSLVAAARVATLLLVCAATQAYADTAVSTHVVQAGETLSDIAASVGIDSATLAALNAIEDANVLSVGQSIKLPATSVATAPAAPAATAASASPSGTYTVAAGDTLWSVAQQFSTTTAALMDANHLDDPDHLAAGAQLALPKGAAAVPASHPSSAAAAPNSAPAVSPGSGATPAAVVTSAAPKRGLLVPYTVQAGETLGQVARQFDVPADAIVQASGLDDPNRLSVGTVLKVPLPGREHVVQAGETLSDIAAQERVDLGSLVDFNALDDPQLIHVGQVVLVPAAPTGQTAASNTNRASTAAAPAASASVPATPGPPAAAPSAAQVSDAPATPIPAVQPASAHPVAKAATPSPVTTQSAAQSAVPRPTPKPAVPVAVVAPPAGSPSDGLAGGGLKLLGAPYVWGGSSPSGFDCSGFVWYVARQAGKQLSRGMLGEYDGGPHPSRDELKPGDLVFFQNTFSAGLSHNGIYVGNGQFVHAADEAAGVTTSSLGTAYWSSHWFGATRLP